MAVTASSAGPAPRLTRQDGRRPAGWRDDVPEGRATAVAPCGAKGYVVGPGIPPAHPKREPPMNLSAPVPAGRSRIPFLGFILPALSLMISGCGVSPQAQDGGLAGPMDVVIENGRVVDGTGAAWFYGDVGIRGDRVVAVTPTGGLADVEVETGWMRPARSYLPGSSISSPIPGAVLEGGWGGCWEDHPGHHHRDHGGGVDQRALQRAHRRGPGAGGPRGGGGSGSTSPGNTGSTLGSRPSSTTGCLPTSARSWGQRR